MIGVTVLLLLAALLLLPLHADRPRDARGGLAAGIRRGWSASTRRWMIALGWGMAAAIGSIAGMLIAPVVFLEPNMMVGVLHLRLRRAPCSAA